MFFICLSIAILRHASNLIFTMELSTERTGVPEAQDPRCFHQVAPRTKDQREVQPNAEVDADIRLPARHFNAFAQAARHHVARPDVALPSERSGQPNGRLPYPAPISRRSASHPNPAVGVCSTRYGQEMISQGSSGAGR